VAPWQEPEPVADAVSPDVLVGAPLPGILGVAIGLALAPFARVLARALFPAPEEFVPRWGVAHAFLVTLATLALVVLMGAVSGALGREPTALLGLGVSAVILGGACALVLLLAERLDPAGWRCLGLGRGANGRAVLLGAATYLLAWPALLGSMLLWPWVLRAAGIEPEPQEIALQMLQLSGPALWGAAALAVLVMPLLEEILFRAFLQPLLVSALGVTGGVGATSVAFAALHGASAFLPIFTLSLVLGAVMLRTRRLSSAFCVHALHNGVTLLLLFLLPGSRELLGSEGALPCPSLP
jgi:membrane protease YdiL (CAAX protease family)